LKDDRVFIKHILDEIEYVLKVTKIISLDELLKEETLKKALLRSLEIVGEASKNISEETKNKHSDIPWKEVAGLRDKLIHFYFGVDWNIVWDVIKTRLPKLKEDLQTILG
jgi:uncharacterized protein with HEPN domain